MNWKDNFREGKELILSTCSKKCEPHANIAISLGFLGGKILVADCQMKNTIKNINENKKICVIGKYIRIKGTPEVFSKGKYFDLCTKKTKDYKVNSAILLSVNEVFDLNKVEKIKKSTTLP